MSQKTLRILRQTLFLGSMGLLSACSIFSPPPVTHGSLIDKQDYSHLTPGSTTRNEVVEAIGTPTAHATFNDNTWYYISLTKDLVPLSYPVVDTQKVLVLNFDNRGTLQKMALLHKKDAIRASMVGDVTKTPGTHISVIQEILGNVGRYNPLTSMGSTFGGLGGNNGSGPLNNQGVGGGGVGNTLQ